MGVRNLTTVAEGGKIVDVAATCQDGTIVVDLSGLIHHLAKQPDSVDKVLGICTGLYHTVVGFVNAFRAHNITLLFVLDGPGFGGGRVQQVADSCAYVRSKTAACIASIREETAWGGTKLSLPTQTKSTVLQALFDLNLEIVRAEHEADPLIAALANQR